MKTKDGLVVRSLLAAVALFAVLWLCWHADQGGMKGTAIAGSDLAITILVAGCASAVSCRAWHWFPAPFIAGIFGVMFSGPFGGVLGVAVGVVVASLLARTAARIDLPRDTSPQK
jgi:hypothetical protein